MRFILQQFPTIVLKRKAVIKKGRIRLYIYNFQCISWYKNPIYFAKFAPSIFYRLMNLKLRIYIISDNKINILEYNLLQKNLNRTGGGVVLSLYLRHSLQYSERTRLISYHFENQSFVIQFMPQNSRWTSLINII